MNTTAKKRPTMFRLDAALVERLKEMARDDSRSLNNFVECVLSRVVRDYPNAVTRAAIREMEQERLSGGGKTYHSVEELERDLLS